MQPRKNTSTLIKQQKKSSKTSTLSANTSKRQKKKPSVESPTTKSSGKNIIKTPQKRKTTPKKPEPKLKRKQLTPEEMHPFSTFPYRLEYQDGQDHRTCHFQTEEHRTKHIQRYGLKKNQYIIDDATS